MSQGVAVDGLGPTVGGVRTGHAVGGVLLAVSERERGVKRNADLLDVNIAARQWPTERILP